MRMGWKKAGLVVAAMAVAVLVAVTAPGVVYCAEDEDSKIIEDKFKIRMPTYSYKSLGQRDPFRSLIQTAEQAEHPTDKPRTPLESYNISQLRLIAIVISSDGAYALVVLPDGKSYTLREGMTVGLHAGIVKEIRSDQLIVETAIIDHKGNIKQEETALKLRKEGDK